jgi:hypothetical protein
VRRSIQTVTPAFSARRMMKEYVSTLYRKALSPSGAAVAAPRPSRI